MTEATMVTKFSRRGWSAVALGAALALGLTSAARAQITDDESKCQIGTSLANGKFVTEKAKCLIKCEQGARKGANPRMDCFTPFGGTTATCVQLATSKAEGLEQSKCKKDCPECYSGGDCTADSMTRVANTEGNVDTLNLVVYCDDSGSPDGLNAAEAKCQDTVAKTLSNFAAKKLKCLSKCRSDEHKSKIPTGSCTPPPSDMKTSDCIGKNTTKAVALIDNKCDAAVAPKADKPECYGTADGTSLVAAVEAAVDNGDAGLYCSSPSGAFID
jgi:hypothetical protein